MAMRCSLRIGVLVETRYLAQRQPGGLMAELERRGHEVIRLIPEDTAYEIGVDTWLEGFDLIVARGRGWPLLWVLRWAESRHIPTINRCASIAAVYNKAEMGLKLAAAGVPVPRSFVGLREKLARRVPASDYPLITKPVFGDNCRGLLRIYDPAEFTGIDSEEQTVLAQRYVPGDGHDLKLYGIGPAVWAVRKPSPLDGRSTSTGDAELVVATSELQALARRCAALFGLELYGVDCIETPDGPVVIEVNDFPNFTSVPDSSSRLADHVIRCFGQTKETCAEHSARRETT